MQRVLLVMALATTAFAIAGEPDDMQHEMEVKIVRNDGNGTFHFNSADAGFRLLDMQIGENRSYVDDDGRNVLITRKDGAFDINVDGDSFEIPAPGSLHFDGRMPPDFGDLELEIEHDAIRHELAEMHSGSMIRTEKPLDVETRQAIEQLLKNAGHDGDIRFVDAESLPLPVVRDVHVIRKKEL